MLDKQVREFYKEKIENRAFYLPGIPLADLRRGADAVFNDKEEIIPIPKWEERIISFQGLGLQDYVPDMKVRIYWPTVNPENLPIVLYFHGGGFILHNVASHDALTRKLATAWNAVVISAEYRLCPENPYPAYLHDGCALLCWAHKHAKELGGKPERIILSGDSAGASICAAVSRLAAMQGTVGTAALPTIFAQILFYGTYGAIPDDESESMRQFGGGDYVLPRAMIEEFASYVKPEGFETTRETGDTSIDISGVEDPFFYPGRGDLPKNMPRSIIVSAECDPLRDDGEAYAAALKEAGCDVTAIRAKGMMHGFLLYWHKFDAARELIESIPSYLVACLPKNYERK